MIYQVLLAIERLANMSAYRLEKNKIQQREKLRIVILFTSQIPLYEKLITSIKFKKHTLTKSCYIIKLLDMNN